MSKYTTGEMAKLADVTVRTVQYYDNRGILVPSELSEGGRRLYSEDDLKKLKLICCLKNLGIPLNEISKILKADNSKNVVSAILEQQIVLLKSDILKQKEQLKDAEDLLSEINASTVFSAESLNDIMLIMKNKKSLKSIHLKMVLVGIIVDIIEISTIYVWCAKGLWQPFAAGMVIVIIMISLIFEYYYKNISYICPECHRVFKPAKKEMFFSKHTPKTRKLTCTHCGYKGYCVETANIDDIK